MDAALTVLARAQSDAGDRLVAADEPLAGLQRRCGGESPGLIAVPALLEIVRKARLYRLKLARRITAQDGAEAISAWVEVSPRQDGQDGCDIVLRNWQASRLPAEDAAILHARRAGIDRALAELTARLDPSQNVLSVQADAADLQEVAAAMRGGIGRPWTDFVVVARSAHAQPLHWRLLDGSEISVPGSARAWRAHLFPQDMPGGEPAGFELCLTSDQPIERPAEEEPAGPGAPSGDAGLVGRDIAPILRQPIARIIANAETIRTRLAGPLADEYSGYAADIATAGQHLLGLLDDLADLEVVESDDFTVSPDRIDLADVARRAAGILGMRARERGIVVTVPEEGVLAPAIGEFRRVLQILLNLVGNAIRYSPENSKVRLDVAVEHGRAWVSVADQGCGLDSAQQAVVFEKFERLGRSGDGGSGLGLYISRRLARAMDGELSVESAAGEGARFILELPDQ
jgi:hypothetical protein